MAKGLNMVQLIGNLGADPDTRYTGNGTAITTIRIATSESWKDKESGEQQERVEWHRVKFFGRLAEIAGEYLKKGRQVYVQGSLRTEKYTDKDNIERFSTDVIATEMQMLGGNREDGGGNSGGHEGGASRGGGQQQRSQGGGGSSQRSQGGNQQRPAAQRAPALAGGFDDGMDQDVPF